MCGWMVYGDVTYLKKKLAQVRGINKQKMQAKCEVLFSYRLSKNGFFVKPPSTLPSFGSVVSILGCLVGAAQLTFQVPFLFCLLVKNAKCVCKPSGYVKSPQNVFRKKKVWRKILQLTHLFSTYRGHRWIIIIHIDINSLIFLVLSTELINKWKVASVKRL